MKGSSPPDTKASRGRSPHSFSEMASIQGRRPGPGAGDCLDCDFIIQANVDNVHIGARALIGYDIANDLILCI